MIDLVVVGGGQAGLAAGAAAAERGLSVAVLEKTDRIGGSAYFSAGILWTAPDVATMRRLLPDGDPELGRVLVEGFEPAVAKARDAGVPVTERWTEHLGFGVAYRTDIHALHAHWASKIDDLRLNTPVKRAARWTATASRASSPAARSSKRAPCCWPAEVSKVTRSSSSASSAGTPTGSSCAPTPAASATASGSRSPRARRPAAASARSTATPSPRR